MAPFYATTNIMKTVYVMIVEGSGGGEGRGGGGGEGGSGGREGSGGGSEHFN